MSCQLNPGCRVLYNQVFSTLCRRHKRNYLLLTSSFALTRLHHWFTCVQLIVFTPAKIVIPAFPSRSPPIPLGTRSIRRFGNYSWKSSPRDLLSSVIKHQNSKNFVQVTHGLGLGVRAGFHKGSDGRRASKFLRGVTRDNTPACAKLTVELNLR